MQPGKKLQILGQVGFVVLALLTSRAGAAEPAAILSGPAVAERSGLPGREEILSPRLCALEQRLFDQIHDGRFGEFSLLEAGLIAGGVDRDDELRRYCKRFDALVESLRRSGKIPGAPRERAQAVFSFLHQSILRGGYDLQASDVRQAFDHGRFNCVTASLLFNCLAERFQLRAVGLEIPGHAMSRLELPEETLDIETTCPRWFTLIDRAGRPRGAVAANSPRTADSPQAEKEPTVQAEPAVQGLARDAEQDGGRAAGRGAAAGDRRQVTEVELVATIYYNRGVDLLAEKRFAAAAAANAKAVRLDPNNATAKGNLLATINNWAIELGMSGEYEQAAELLRLGLATDARYEAFHSNYVQLFRQWSEYLCRSGRYEDAARLLARAAQEQPGEGFFREAAIEILHRWAKR
jgi:hypothetical protein